MIKNIVFDFGDIFVNLRKEATALAFDQLGINPFTPELDTLNKAYEIGAISEMDFLSGFQKQNPAIDVLAIRNAWNQIIGDFPLYRLEFLQLLKPNYRLFLLSNTDSTHISYFEHQVGLSFSRDFYSCFEKVYFSFEIGMRKPDAICFQTVMARHELQAKYTLFVDDKKENTDAASALGLSVWNLQVGQEDVVQLFEKNIL
ncbi:MAG: HAD-IA family hydrolase [Flavobacterium sp.]|nr:HAD-IA family hydrolase [Flavobacterium sp.]